MGLYNKNFKISSEEISEEKSEKVEEFPADFNIMAGPMKLQGTVYKNLYVLEIHYNESYESHRKTLPLNGFNSQLCLDYAEKVNEIAENFCKEKGFTLENHLNSWPEFQAIILKSKKEGKKYKTIGED